MKQKKLLAIIPARSGSKRIPGKNIKKFAGKPLIAYAIEQAKNVSMVDRVIVDTDSPEIAVIATNVWRRIHPKEWTQFCICSTG